MIYKNNYKTYKINLVSIKVQVLRMSFQHFLQHW
jgi:hypothetical protein